MSIACIVVTYNRKDLLVECIQALLNQTTPIDKIYIIDNNSSDGTKELLQDKDYFNHPSIEYHNTMANLGGAGGFKFGLEKALENNHEWYWLMDDDIEPLEDSLEKLLLFSNQSKCLHPQKVFLDQTIFEWDGEFDPTFIRTKWYSPERLSSDCHQVKVNYGCFEGMLIHKSIIKKIGLPDERFFIHTDDLLYGYLASLHTDVLYTNLSIFKKKIKKEQFTPFFGKKITYHNGFNQYFNIRNHYLLREHLLERKLTHRFKSFIWYLLKVFKIFTTSLLIHRNLKDTQMIIWGIWDGLIGNFNGHTRFIK